MIRAQIQFPDELYREAKRIAVEQEMTLAEVVRRGVEQVVRLYPPGRLGGQDWQAPSPRSLGAFLAPVEDWRELANET